MGSLKERLEKFRLSLDSQTVRKEDIENFILELDKEINELQQEIEESRAEISGCRNYLAKLDLENDIKYNEKRIHVLEQGKGALYEYMEKRSTSR